MFPNEEEFPPHRCTGPYAPEGIPRSQVPPSTRRKQVPSVFQQFASTKWVPGDGCVRGVPPPLSATPSPDKRSYGGCNRGMGGRRKEEHNHHRMNRRSRPWAP